jgi:four helix bundle protein
MALIVHQLALQTISLLRPLMPRVAQQDRSLAQQLQRAASSVALNLGEAEYSDPGNRRARFHTAAGSAGQTRTALQVAVAWGYVGETQAAPVIEQLDRVVAMLWRLTRGR